jgi:3'-phosphoadenosine 5'-phosphosulfate sulfotransferase (PAPS reductase)/FAD synthetase
VKDEKILVFCSGGKDSVAMLIKMFKLGYKNFTIIFIDTGIEFKQMYKYWDKLFEYLKNKPCKTHIYKSKYTWDQMFYSIKEKGKNKGDIYGFPYMVGPWCNDRLKLEPIKQAKKDFKDYIEYIGYTIDEKSKIRQLKIQNKLKGINRFSTFRKLFNKKTLKTELKEKKHDITNERYILCDLKLKEKDCLNITKENNLYNPLYNYFERTGCWCCPKQPVSSLRQIFLHFPNEWKQLMKWQEDSPNKFKPNISLLTIEKKFILEVKRKNRLKGYFI